MSSCNIEVESEEKIPRRESWFNRRRRSIFSSSRRLWRYGSRKRNSDNASTGSGEASSTISNESSRGNDTVEGSVPTKGGNSRKGEGDAPESMPGMLECPLCLNTQAAENFPSLSTCHHRSCLTCLRQYLSIEITESRVNLMCPECQEKLHPTDMRSILDHDSNLFAKWEEFTLRRALSIDPDCRWCPAPDCGFAVIAHGCASCPRLVCQRPGCQTEFCYHCRQEWHPNQTCDAAHLQRTRQLRIRSNSAAYSHRSSYHADEIKPCPKCGVLIVKLDDGSCNHITCSVCEADFCWLCLQEITDLHYLSPSGCTFWGKKRWSKKKKILWQLGLLIGAPICIGIAAGIAVPAIMVALPIWVGRRVRSLLEHREASKLKRNLVFATCVSFSVVLSPVVAALAIGIGVPVILIYVYGVVPFSFCRSGYGDQKSGASSMLPANFLFDLGGTSGQPANTAANEGTSFHGPPNAMAANPSIGEASVGGITMGSFNTSRGSNLDKMGRTDLDLASTMAMAGTSITGSITGVNAGGALNSRADVIVKDLDQHSILTQTSAGSIPGVASVQVHMTDPASEHGSSVHLPASGTTRTSIKYSGGMRKTRAANKRTSSVKSIPPNKMESHGVQVVEDSLIISMTVDGSPPLTIVDETEMPQTLELNEAPCTSSVM